MISQNNNYLSEASQSLYEFNADEITRQKCRARQEYYRTQNTYKKTISDLQEQVNNFQQTIVAKDNTIAEQNATIVEKDNALAEKNAQLIHTEAEIAQSL